VEIMNVFSKRLVVGLVTLGVLSLSPSGNAAPSTGLVVSSPTTPQRAGAIHVAPKVQVKPALAVLGAKATLRAQVLTPKGDPVVGGEVYFTVDNDSIYGGKTDAEGYAAGTYLVPTTAHVGGHAIAASYTGNDPNYPKNSGAGTLTVLKTAVRLTVDVGRTHSLPPPIRPGDEIEVSGFLSRLSDNGGIDGRQIDLKLNGAPLAKVVTKNGLYSYTLKAPNTTKLVAEASFSGDDKYLANAGQKALQDITKPLVPVFVKVPLMGPLLLTVGQTATLTAQLVPLVITPSNVAAVKDVELLFRGEDSMGPGTAFGTAKTNALGVATLTFKVTDRLISGKTSIHVHFSDVVNELAVVQNNNPIIVMPAPLALTVTGPTSAKIGQTLTYRQGEARDRQRARDLGDAAAPRRHDRRDREHGRARLPVHVQQRRRDRPVQAARALRRHRQRRA
jgi:hypothetical protein